MKPELTEKVLGEGDKVFFYPATPQYGRAEFHFCPVWGKNDEGQQVLQRMYIYPVQQPDAKYFYRVDHGWGDSISVSSWTHKGVERPWIWYHMWCKEHNTQSFAAYVPLNANHFVVNKLTTLGIYFDYEERTNEVG